MNSGLVLAAARRQHIDFIVRTDKAQREPLLLLAAIFAAPCLADNIARDVVGDPIF